MFQLHVQLSQQFVIYKQTNQHKLPNATEQRVTLQATNFRTTRGLYFMYVFRNAGARNEAMAYITGGLIAWEQHCISDTLSKVTPTAVHAASRPHIRSL